MHDPDTHPLSNIVELVGKEVYIVLEQLLYGWNGC